MSWHTSILYLKGHTGKAGARFFENLGLPGAQLKREISWEEAGSSGLEGRSLGVVDGWTVVTDPTMFMVVGDEVSVVGSGLFPIVVESRLRAFSEKNDVLGILLEGSSGTYGFSLWRCGERRRLYLVQEGAVIASAGEPLPEEAAVFRDHADAEMAILDLAQKLTVSFASCDKVQFSEYGFDDEHISFVHS